MFVLRYLKDSSLFTSTRLLFVFRTLRLTCVPMLSSVDFGYFIVFWTLEWLVVEPESASRHPFDI